MYKPTIHYDRDIEAAVLGACLLEKHAFSEIKGLLFKEVFYFNEHRLVFEAMESLWEVSFPIDILTVTNYIARTNGIEQIDGISIPVLIVRITKAVFSSAHLQFHAFLLRQLYAERELIRIKSDMFEGGDILERTKKMQDELFKLTQIKVTNDWKDMSEVIVELYQHMDAVKGQTIIGVPSGFRQLDIITRRILCAGQMVILAARPSVGKSALLGAICMYAAKQGEESRDYLTGNV
jgi:replicative DNA helicase